MMIACSSCTAFCPRLTAEATPYFRHFSATKIAID